MRGRIFERKPMTVIALGIFLAVVIVYVVLGIRSAYRLYPGLPGYQVHATDGTPSWAASLALVKFQINPYSPEGQALVETFYFGRPLLPEDLGRVQDKHSFVYPLQATFLFIPTVFFDLSTALVILWLSLFLSYLLAAGLWIQLMQFSSRKMLRLLLLTGLLLVPEAWYSLQNRQPTVWVFLLLTAAVCGMVNPSKLGDVAVGVLLAWAMVKPQSAILVLMYAVLLYPLMRQGFSGARWFWFGLGGTTIGLLVVTNLILPGWTQGFLQTMSAYREFAGTTGAESLFGADSPWVQISVFGTTAIWIGMIAYMIKHPHWKMGHLIAITYAFNLQTFVFPTHLYNLIFGVPILLLTLRSLFSISFDAHRELNATLLVLLAVCVFTLFYYWLGIFQDAGIVALTSGVKKFTAFLPWRVYYFPLVSLVLGVFLFLREIRVNDYTTLSC